MKLGTAHRGGRDWALGHAERPEVPGYRILERLGGDVRGGVVVWKAEGPGGVLAALRVVRLTADISPDRVRGLEWLCRARHPSLLAAFGSWRIGGALVLATELPDRSLWDRFLEAREAGSPGIPRDELMSQLVEAARAIDYVNGNVNGTPRTKGPGPGLGIPHGEVTPRTILFVGGDIKVADADAALPGDDPYRDASAGLDAPLWGLDYAAPERFSGRSSRHSDQYSLAVTYCHLRVGRLPFPAQGTETDSGPLHRPPVLADLLACERPAVARALAGDPNRRWPSCLSFVNALRADALAADALATAAGHDREDDTLARPQVNRAAARTLAAAASLATLAGTLLLASRPVPRNRALPNPSRAVGMFSTTLSAPDVALHPTHSLPPRPWDSGDVMPVTFPGSPPTAEPGPVLPPPPSPDVAVGPPVEAAAATVPALVKSIAVPETVPPSGRSPAATGEAPAPALVLGVMAGTASFVPWLTWTETAVAAAIPGGDVRTEHPTPPSVHAPTIRLVASETLTVEVGRTASLPLTLSCQGIDGPVEVVFQGLPRGVTASPGVFPARAAKPGVTDPQPRAPSSVEVRAEPNSPEGESLARLIASAGSARAETTVLVSVRPTPALAARRRGDLLLRREEFGGALAAYSEAITLNPTDPLALHGRGLAAYGKGDLNPALADLDAALRLMPETPTALNNRGLIRLAKGDTATAIVDFDTAIRLDPGYAVVRYNRGRAYSESGGNEPALADFDEVIRLAPKFSKAFKARADVLSRKGDRDRALADYDEAIRLRPDDPAALNNRGLLLFARGDYHRAIADFDEAIRISPRYAVVRYNRGRVYAYLGDTVEAMTSFDHAIRLDPTFTRAAQARAELLNRAGGSPSALGVATRRDSAKSAAPVPPRE